MDTFIPCNRESANPFSDLKSTLAQEEHTSDPSTDPLQDVKQQIEIEIVPRANLRKAKEQNIDRTTDLDEKNCPTEIPSAATATITKFDVRYKSGSEGETDDEAPKKKKLTSPKEWLKTRDFANAKEAEDYIKNLNTWKKSSTYTTLDGVKVKFRCSGGKYRRHECPKCLCLLYHAENTTVTAYETADEHENHGKRGVGKPRGMTSPARELVRQLVQDGIKKPNAIIAAFRHQKVEVPEKMQLINFLASLRNENSHHDSSAISASELETWCRNKTEIPVDDDEPFVLSYAINVQDDKQDLKIVISTKHLLRIASNSVAIQADTTHKLIWQGYPILIVGTSDAEGLFHPFAIAVCNGESEANFAFIFNAVQSSLKMWDIAWNPNILLADASEAVTNGFHAVFGSPVRRLQCYSNVIKNIEPSLRPIREKISIRADIDMLQLSTNDDIFEVAARLFQEKWRSREDEEINNFLCHFESTLFGEDRYWYEGACSHFPSSNNGLDTIVAEIKKEHTFRERLPTRQFLETLDTALVKKWSLERNSKNPNSKPFVTRPNPKTKVWSEAYRWVKSKPKIAEEKGEMLSVFYISLHRDDVTELVQKHKDNYLKWGCFEEFVKDSSLMCKVTVDTTESGTSSCTCRAYCKQNMCEHSLGMLVYLGKEKVPVEAKVPAVGKRKRGRPPKKALLIR